MQKPIGVKGRRVEKHHIILVSDGQTEPLIISTVDEVMSYSNPSVPGALLKAALVCAGVVREDIDEELSKQLEKVFLVRIHALYATSC